MPEEKKVAPNRSIELTFPNGNSYSVKYPNTGQLMDIEILKLQLTHDKYETLRLSYLPSLQERALTAEVVAYFNILIPDLAKTLTVRSLFQLEVEQMKEVVKVYEEQFLPWFEEWNAILAKPKDTI